MTDQVRTDDKKLQTPRTDAVMRFGNKNERPSEKEPLLMEIAHIVMGFHNENEQAHYRMLCDIEKLIASAPSAIGAWVSVLDRLPSCGDVLCARNDGGVEIYRHDLVRDYAIDDAHDTRDSHITHWMQKPDAPRESSAQDGRPNQQNIGAVTDVRAKS